MILGRVDVLEEASRALSEGTLTEPERERACAEAHKLAGSVGTFGFVEASELAQQVRDLLDSGAGLSQAEGARLLELLKALRQALRDAQAIGPKARPVPAVTLPDAPG